MGVRLAGIGAGDRGVIRSFAVGHFDSLALRFGFGKGRLGLCQRVELVVGIHLQRFRLRGGLSVRRLSLREPGFAANAEIGLELVLMGSAVTEVPVSWIDRSFDMGRSSFGIVESGGGYLRVLARLAWSTALGLRPLPGGGAPDVTQ